jgi:hypothetical protein
MAVYLLALDSPPLLPFCTPAINSILPLAATALTGFAGPASKITMLSTAPPTVLEGGRSGPTAVLSASRNVGWHADFVVDYALETGLDAALDRILVKELVRAANVSGVALGLRTGAAGVAKVPTRR